MKYSEILEIRLNKFIEIKNQYKDGVNVKDMCKYFKISHQRIYQILKIDIEKLKEKISITKHKESITEVKEPRTRNLAYGMTGRDYIRELVRIRDKHTCQTCGLIWNAKWKRFDVHHLNGLCGKKSKSCDRKKDMDGLITLCHRCHFNHPQHTLKTRKNKNNLTI